MEFGFLRVLRDSAVNAWSVISASSEAAAGRQLDSCFLSRDFRHVRQLSPRIRILRNQRR